MENRVEELRKHLGLNQEDFAKAIRVSRQTVSSIETGKYNPSLDLAFEIADFFGKRIDEIFILERGNKNEIELLVMRDSVCSCRHYIFTYRDIY